MTFFFLAIDPSIGRFDRKMLSQQTLMELFVQDFHPDFSRRFQNESGDFIEKCEWPVVYCSQIKMREVVRNIEISGSSMYPDAPIEAKYFPPTLKYLRLENVRVLGSFDMAAVPESVDYMKLTNASFEGTIDFTAIPKSARELHIYKTSISGTVDLAHLPSDLTLVNIAHNKFQGSIDLEHLPSLLHQMSLNSNEFCGSVSLEKLPSGLRALDLSANFFSGTLCLQALPPRLQRLAIHTNDFSGVIKLEEVPRQLNLAIYPWDPYTDDHDPGQRNANLQIFMPEPYEDA